MERHRGNENAPLCARMQCAKFVYVAWGWSALLLLATAVAPERIRQTVDRRICAVHS